jgi:hypothetical protein
MELLRLKAMERELVGAEPVETVFAPLLGVACARLEAIDDPSAPAVST